MINGKFSFNYSLKNIPNASKKQYQKILVDSMENFINRMRWKLYWTKNPPTNNDKKETFGFKSTSKAPPDPDLKKFEDDMIKLVSELEMKKADNDLQNKLKADIKRINRNKDIIVPSDKTDNFYSIPVQTYKKMLLDNITKEYRKSDMSMVNKINREAAKIARNLELDDRIEAFSLKPAFLTIKDHKPEFPNKISCRLINPSKSNIGIISKNILDRINNELREKLKINQWKSSKEVLKWFNNLEDKKNLKFLKFDVEQFYPSITKSLMSNAINMAKLHTNITKEEETILLHARLNALMDTEGNIWEKQTNPEFDVAMGSMDGAEVAELVGIYLISHMMLKFNKNLFGIYRDDGLMVIRGGGPDVDRARKVLTSIFNKQELKITTEGNTTSVNFLDMELDLLRNTTKPYIKLNCNTKYVSKLSSHPPAVKKSIPEGVTKRLPMLSSSKDQFQQEIPYYQDAMDAAGYDKELMYTPVNILEEKEKAKRGRGVTLPF